MYDEYLECGFWVCRLQALVFNSVVPAEFPKDSFADDNILIIFMCMCQKVLMFLLPWITHRAGRSKRTRFCAATVPHVRHNWCAIFL